MYGRPKAASSASGNAASAARPSAPATAGVFHPRTFNVAVYGATPNGGSRLVQGITARHVDEILSALEERLGGVRILSAEVYNEFTDSYQPMHASDFTHLPSHLELDVKISRVAGIVEDDWTRGPGQERGLTRSNVSAATRAAIVDGDDDRLGETTFRRMIVDKVRVLFLPYFNRHQITRSELADACAVILHRFATERGIDEATLQSNRELKLAESDAIRMLCYEYTVEMGFDKREPDHHHAAGHFAGRAGRRGFAAEQPIPPKGGDVRPLSSPSMHGPLAVVRPGPSSHAADPANRARTVMAQGPAGVRTKPAFGSTSYRFTGPGRAVSPADASRSRPGASLSPKQALRRRYAGVDRVRFEDEGDEVRFRNEPDTGFYYASARHAHSSVGGSHNAMMNASRRPPPAAPGETYWNNSDNFAGAPGNEPAGVLSVTYTVAGTFPGPPDAALAATRDIRTALSPPAIVNSDDDIVITAALHAPRPVTLCWWLAYGPTCIVLNLDKLYANGMVTTFQVAENAVVLTIRGGSLVPGWSYAVHLDVTDAQTKQTASAQTTFEVPTSDYLQMTSPGAHLVGSGTGGPSAIVPPGIGSATDLAARREEYLRAKRSGQSVYGPGWLGLGYVGDGELGSLKEPSPDRRGGQVLDVGSGASTSAGKPAPGTVTSISRVNRASSPTKKATSSVGAVATSNAGSPPPASSSTAVPLSPAGPSGAAASPTVGGGGSSTAAPQGTFQEQLRDFFLHQVEPLYYLSANPSLSEQAFKAAVRGVSKTYWFSQPSSATLTDDLKRTIVRDVKLAIANARDQYESVNKR
jgi:hypothetical protein